MGELGYPGGAWGGEYAQAWDQAYADPRQDDEPVNPDWVEYPFEDLDIWSPLKWLQPTAGDRQAIATASPLLVGLAVGIAYAAFILVSPALNPVPAPRLQSDDLCGLTTGGQDECFWDCVILSDPSLSGQAIGNLTCLQDCFASTTKKRSSDSSCIASLLKDVISQGTCQWEGNGEAEGWNNPPEWGYSDSCDIEEKDDDYYNPDENGDCVYNYSDDSGSDSRDYDFYDYDYGSGRATTGNCDGCNDCTAAITKGTCSSETEALLATDECRIAILEQNPVVVNTIQQVIQYSCSPDADPFNYDDDYDDYSRNKKRKKKTKKTKKTKKNGKEATRLAPVATVTDTYKTELNYENTKHRYSWICSLRFQSSNEHLCAVTLLSVPPQPTVIVGAAHCTYFCMDTSGSLGKIPPCCCVATGQERCGDDTGKCGTAPKAELMTGADAEILCGEWQTGNATQEESGEQYNVVLPIEAIIRHPKFDTSPDGLGPGDGSDIAVFKVQDAGLQDSRSKRIYPACLPPKGGTQPTSGVHSGWSTPPGTAFLEKYGAGYLNYADDFLKQWHLRMDISDRCKDPTKSQAFGIDNTYPTNSYYPPGAICATDFTRQSCFSTGDSGSPLMARDEPDRPMRYNVEGILSFVKGCESFNIGKAQGSSDPSEYQLNQLSENPATYTKLSCFLPWVAEQYGLSYDYDPSTDEACTTPTGQKDDQSQICRTTKGSNLFGKQRGCLFPFYYNNKLYTECTLFEEENFVYPVFRCPTRNITTKIGGINSFDDSVELTDGYCPDLNLTNPETGMFVLNPNIPEEECPPYRRVNPFETCQNNCPGVRSFGIIGGGAVLVAAPFVAGQALLALGGVGAVGAAGGATVTGTACFPPFCRARSNQCCLLRQTRRGIRCPRSC